MSAYIQPLINATMDKFEEYSQEQLLAMDTATDNQQVN